MDTACGAPRDINAGANLAYRRSWALRLKRCLLGNPLSSAVQLEHRLPVFLGVPVFGADPLSSVAYATEEILIVLAAAWMYQQHAPALGLQLPITLSIAALMIIVATSYRRAILMFPMSGGSYTVARRSLGATYGLIAGASLIIDYILTVAVSVSAGVAALTSYFHGLYPYRVELSVAVILFIAFINLRGVRESGWWFALPVYTFVALILVLIGTSLFHIATGTVPQLAPPADAIQPLHGLSLFVILRAFANGCVGLTGTESVSNGISAFKPPEASNAVKSLLIERTGLVTMFIGIGVAAYAYRVVPSASETMLTQLSRANFGEGWLTAIIAYSTLAILAVAANTAYAGFPRLLAYMARDGYAPRQFAIVGDRLVYSRGVMALTAVSVLLVVVFQANVNGLIPLYTIGVFLCFTLSQAGMLLKLLQSRPAGWRIASVLNAVGAFVTAVVTIVVVVTKFTHGAWMVALLIPALVLICRQIKRHYLWFERRMSLSNKATSLLEHEPRPVTAVVLVSSRINQGTLTGLALARSITCGDPANQIRALHVEIHRQHSSNLLDNWQRFVAVPLRSEVPLDVVYSPYRWLNEPVLEYVAGLRQAQADSRIVLIVPEYDAGNWLMQALHNASGRRLREALLKIPELTVLTTRFSLRQEI